AVLRRVLVPDVPPGPDVQVRHHDAEEADLEAGRPDRGDVPQQGPGRDLYARRPGLGGEPGPHGHGDQRLRRPVVRPAVAGPADQPRGDQRGHRLRVTGAEV